VPVAFEQLIATLSTPKMNERSRRTRTAIEALSAPSKPRNARIWCAASGAVTPALPTSGCSPPPRRVSARVGQCIRPGTKAAFRVKIGSDDRLERERL
jgi:hypothetical protein